MGDFSIVSSFFFFFFFVVVDVAALAIDHRGEGREKQTSVIGHGTHCCPTTAADGRINGILISSSNVP
jgi:hypothetical protein